MVDLILNLNLNVILNEQKDVLKSYYFFDFIVLLFSEETKKTKYPLALSFLLYQGLILSSRAMISLFVISYTFFTLLHISFLNQRTILRSLLTFCWGLLFKFVEYCFPIYFWLPLPGCWIQLFVSFRCFRSQTVLKFCFSFPGVCFWTCTLCSFCSNRPFLPFWPILVLNFLRTLSSAICILLSIS